MYYENISVKFMHELDSKEKDILEVLLDGTSKNADGVDYLSFRAHHFNAVELINRLECQGYILLDQGHYFLSLTALAQIDKARAIEILNNAEKLFGTLKDHYLVTQHEAVGVAKLANKIGLDQNVVRETLSYMIEGTWWGGRSKNFFGDFEAYIQPSETILKFNSFADIVKQLRSWQSKRIKDRRQALAQALLIHPTMPSESAQPVVNIPRQKPDWFMQIPESPRDVLAEVYSAMSLDLRALPAMGVRAVIDVVCTKLIGDSGSFENKIKLLRNNGHITETDRTILSIAIDAGNASAHRGYVPSREDLTTLLDVAEHLLRAQYVLPEAAKKIKANTPTREAKVLLTL